jgi:hypothetical protein
MNFTFYPLKINNYQGKAFVTKLSLQSDNSFYCSLAFANELLLKIEANKKGTEIKDFQPIAIHKEFGRDSVAVCSGLQASTSGDMAFTVLHTGQLPSSVMKIFGNKWPELDSLNFVTFLNNNSGGMGFSVRHSIGQVQKGQFKVRRSHEAGALVDVMLLGDNLFGLTGNEIWREPYLNTEKRYSLRSDLSPNGQLHRDADDNFWLLGRDDKLLRLKVSDIKAKPTFKKINGPCFELSSASTTDSWLYGVCGNKKELFRARINSVTQEEEIQLIQKFDAPITSLCAADLAHGPFVFVVTKNSDSTDFWRIEVKKDEDPEMLPPPPKVQLLEQRKDIVWLQHLQLRSISESQFQFWASVESKDHAGPTLTSFTLE